MSEVPLYHRLVARMRGENTLYGKSIPPLHSLNPFAGFGGLGRRALDSRFRVEGFLFLGPGPPNSKL